MFFSTCSAYSEARTLIRSVPAFSNRLYRPGRSTLARGCCSAPFTRRVAHVGSIASEEVMLPIVGHTNRISIRRAILLNPDYTAGFVTRVESAMAARVSLRSNSPSYCDERKASETLAAAAISGRSRSPAAYSGLKPLSRVNKGIFKFLAVAAITASGSLSL